MTEAGGAEPSGANGAGGAAPVVDISDLVFGWTRDAVTLDIPAFTLAHGEKVFLRGPSGSGKSTLLGLICGVLTPRSGRVSVLGRDMGAMSGAARDAARAADIGVIFQLFNLLPYLSVIENVTLPCRFSSARRDRALSTGRSLHDEALRLLGRLGLSDPKLVSSPARALSVGQQQRVAAARALMGAPALIIADEPTSALDADRRDAFIRLLIEEAEANGSSLMFVSHDGGLARFFDRDEDLRTLNRAWESAERAA